MDTNWVMDNMTESLINESKQANCTAQKMKFSIKDIFSKCDQSRSLMWKWSHLLKNFLIEHLIF